MRWQETLAMHLHMARVDRGEQPAAGGRSRARAGLRRDGPNSAAIAPYHPASTAPRESRP